MFMDICQEFLYKKLIKTKLRSILSRFKMGSNASKCGEVKEIHQNERNLKKIVVSKEEWNEILEKGPGVRMYKGLQTLFYNGEKLWEGDFYNGKPLVYDRKERQAWQQVIVLPGVKTIPKLTFRCCKNVSLSSSLSLARHGQFLYASLKYKEE